MKKLNLIGVMTVTIFLIGSLAASSNDLIKGVISGKNISINKKQYAKLALLEIKNLYFEKGILYAVLLNKNSSKVTYTPIVKAYYRDCIKVENKLSLDQKCLKYSENNYYEKKFNPVTIPANTTKTIKLYLDRHNYKEIALIVGLDYRTTIRIDHKEPVY